MLGYLIEVLRFRNQLVKQRGLQNLERKVEISKSIEDEFKMERKFIW